MKKTFLLATTFSSLHVLGNIYPNQYFTHALILSSIQSYTWYYNTTEWVHFWVSIIWYVLNFSTHFFWQKSGYHYLLLLLKFSCKSNKYISFGFFCQYFWWEMMIKPKQLIIRTFSAPLCSILLDYNSEYYQLKWTELHVCHINEKFAILSLHLIIIIIIQFM